MSFTKDEILRIEARMRAHARAQRLADRPSGIVRRAAHRFAWWLFDVARGPWLAQFAVALENRTKRNPVTPPTPWPWQARTLS